MLGLRGLGLASNNHLMRSLDLKRRNVMFGFNLFQPAFRCGNVLTKLFCILCLDPLLGQFLRIGFNFALECPSFTVNRRNRIDQALH